MCSCNACEEGQDIVTALVVCVSNGRVIVLVPVSCMPSEYKQFAHYIAIPYQDPDMALQYCV
jgi:acyl-CoA thioesterase